MTDSPSLVGLKRANVVALIDATNAAISRNATLRISTARMTTTDTDPDGAGVGVASVSSPSARGGTTTLANDIVTYTPPRPFPCPRT